MNYKTVRGEMIKKYIDAIIDICNKHNVDMYVAFEMFLTNARAYASASEIPYIVEVEVDYLAVLENAKALYEE